MGGFGCAVQRRGHRSLRSGPTSTQSCEVPRIPRYIETRSVRGVLLPLIEGTAGPVGHAEIVRGSIDCATGLPVMAAVGGRPPTPWITPWVGRSDAIWLGPAPTRLAGPQLRPGSSHPGQGGLHSDQRYRFRKRG